MCVLYMLLLFFSCIASKAGIHSPQALKGGRPIVEPQAGQLAIRTKNPVTPARAGSQWTRGDQVGSKAGGPAQVSSSQSESDMSRVGFKHHHP